CFCGPAKPSWEAAEETGVFRAVTQGPYAVWRGPARRPATARDSRRNRSPREPCLEREEAAARATTELRQGQAKRRGHRQGPRSSLGCPLSGPPSLLPQSNLRQSTP